MRKTIGNMEEKIPTEFRIKELMKQKKITNKALADRMGVTAPAIRQMLTAESLTTYTLQKLARCLGVEIWELFAKKESTRKEPTMTCPYCGKPISICLSKAEA